jgi:hypothetical protein
LPERVGDNIKLSWRSWTDLFIYKKSR